MLNQIENQLNEDKNALAGVDRDLKLLRDPFNLINFAI